MGVEFDFQNFGIGFGSGVASSYAVFRARRFFQQMRDSASEQAASAQAFARQSGHRRYTNDLIKQCQTSHLAGDRIDLAELLIEPRFLRATDFVSLPDDDDVKKDVFDVVPQIHDHPYLHAPYNLMTMTIEELGMGDRAMMLLGRPGSGRTTALMAIALWSLQVVNFDPPKDSVQERLDQEQEELSRDERAQRIKDHFDLQQRAKEQMEEESGTRLESGELAIPPFRRSAPVYTHLTTVLRYINSYSDPAEALVRALQYQTGSITSKTMPRRIYKLLSEGHALVLLDGYDELTPDEQKQIMPWLKAFLDIYYRNFIIITGAPSGYGSLQQIGFHPVFLRPWHDLDRQHFVEKWQANWNTISGKRRNPMDESVVEDVLHDGWGYTPLELTLRLWSQAQYGNNRTIEQWFRDTIFRTLPEAETHWDSLVRLGGLQLDEGSINELRAVQVETGSVSETDISVETSLDDTEVDETTDTDDKQIQNARKNMLSLIGQLRKANLIERDPNGNYRFKHSVFASFLASYLLHNADSMQIKSENPAWQMAFNFAVTHTSLDSLASHRLQMTSPDVLNTQLLEMIRWLRDVSEDADWQTQLIDYLGDQLLHHDQFELVQERLLAGMVESRDPRVVPILQEALQSSDANLRRLACLGIGVFRDINHIKVLLPYLEDEDRDVRIASAIALGAIRSDEALEVLADTLFESDSEAQRQAIAETFALIPDEGYPLLYDILNNEKITDIILRRVAIFGLRRVRTNWSLITIYKVYLDDPEWYVHSAAQIAFNNLQASANDGVVAYPAIEAIPWLLQWASQLDDEDHELSSHELLLKATEDSDPVIRELALATLGQIGIVENADTLYSALNDPQPDIRNSAFRALGDIQYQVGSSLPAPA